jgi:hypothetical protein
LGTIKCSYSSYYGDKGFDMNTLNELLEIKKSLEIEQNELWEELHALYLNKKNCDDEHYINLRKKYNKVCRKLNISNIRIENL